MIDKLNITIENKNTKKIKYKFYLDEGVWWKSEYNNEGKLIHYVNSSSGYIGGGFLDK